MTNDELRRLAEAAKPQCDYHPNMTYEAVERVPEDGDCVEAVILFDDNDYAAEVYGHMAYDVDGMALAKYWAAASPDAVLKLLDENDRLRGLLKRCEWSVHDDDYRNYCPICMEYQDDGHAPDCELAQALRGEG